ncbi:MAG: MATE family efflux transporter [Bacteroidaceae bacterium]|nr:MATE family efflux transporter [Bacteroidaceae bacterium]
MENSKNQQSKDTTPLPIKERRGGRSAKGNSSVNSLGTAPVGALLMQYAVPAIIAMTASSLYNMVDSIFIGQGVGPMAIAGLAITFPLMNLSAAFGAMVGVGTATMISVRLGQKNQEEAQHFFGNSLTLNILIGVLFMIGVLAFLDPILCFFGASEQTLPYAREYMEWILYGNVFTHLYFGLNAVLRSAGHPRMAMSATILTVLINTALDPLFIYGFGLGIKGAAMATVLSQCISLCWQVYIFSRPTEVVFIRRDTWSLRPHIVGGILSIGLSPFLMNACSCLVVLLINRGMVEYGGDLAVGAYGIVNRVLFLFAMIVMGLNQGMQPIAGYNYGAQLHLRVKEVLYKTITYATIVMTTGFLLCELFAEIIVQAFTTDPDLISIAAHGMRIDVALFPIIGFQMVTGNFFQSIGQAGKSIYLSLTRQLIFLVPCLLILPRFFALDGVWISLPVSDGLAALNAAVLLYQTPLSSMNTADKAKATSSLSHILRLPHRIHYFAVNRVAPYIPLFSLFQHEDEDIQGKE